MYEKRMGGKMRDARDIARCRHIDPGARPRTVGPTATAEFRNDTLQGPRTVAASVICTIRHALWSSESRLRLTRMV